MSPWRKKISKALLQREINSQVNEFASGICESLEYLKEIYRDRPRNNNYPLEPLEMKDE